MNPSATSSSHIGLAYGLLVTFLMCSWYWWVQPLVFNAQANATRVEQFRFGIDRINAVVQTKQKRLDGITQPAQSSNTQRIFFKGSTASIATANLQDRIKSIILSQHGSLSNSYLEDDDTGQKSKIVVSVEFFADIDSLQKILHSIESSQPYIFIELLSVRIRHQFNSDEKPQSLSVLMTAVAYREPKIL